MGFFRQDTKSKDIFAFVKNKTPALQMGTLIHAHLLSPEILPDLQHLVKDLETRFPAVEGSERVPATDDKPFVKRVARKPSAMERVNAAVSAAQANEAFMAELEGTEREYAGVVEDYHGIKARLKCDALNFNTGIMQDVKTSSKRFAKFEKDVLSEEPQIPYYIQAALYLDLANHINKLNGIDTVFTEFRWLFVGTRFPETGVVTCPQHMIERGRKEIQIYIDHIKAGKEL